MSFGVWIEVPCAKCSVTAEGSWTFGNHIHRRELSDRLKKVGWKRYGDDWFCRRCDAEIDAGRAALAQEGRS